MNILSSPTMKLDIPVSECDLRVHKQLVLQTDPGYDYYNDHALSFAISYHHQFHDKYPVTSTHSILVVPDCSILEQFVIPNRIATYIKFQDNVKEDITFKRWIKEPSYNALPRNPRKDDIHQYKIGATTYENIDQLLEYVKEYPELNEIIIWEPTDEYQKALKVYSPILKIEGNRFQHQILILRNESNADTDTPTLWINDMITDAKIDSYVSHHIDASELNEPYTLESGYEFVHESIVLFMILTFSMFLL